MIYLNAADTRESLPMPDAIEAMRVAFTEESETPLRIPLGGSMFMPGRVGDVTAIKVVSTVPGNPVGLVAVFGADGNPLGIVDGITLTAIRTGAVAGLATDVLAPDSASTLAMLGSGAMAFDQIEAVRSVREIERILVWSRNRANAERLAERVGGEAVDRADDAVSEAEVISCATPATRPLFDPDLVREGAHINAVGAFRPDMVEVDRVAVERAYVVVDDYDAAAAEAGDLIQAGRTPNASLREVLAGSHPAIGEDLTLFKSVGVAAQDVTAGHAALVNAKAAGRGVELSL
ncbi:MAG: ornithine cyclodeaminase family protein [Acidimicrobiia bacterium]